MAEPNPELDQILRALADPTRRELYLGIARKPGQSTSELAQATRSMTRWGVMKHLDVLRDAGLIQTLSAGRQRHHYHERAALLPLAEWLRDAGVE